MDRFTEAIAHFIGLFQISTDELRLRKDYTEFQASRAEKATPPELPTTPVEVKAPHQFVDMNPGVKYLPVPPKLEWLTPWSHVDYHPPQVPTPDGPVLGPPGGGLHPALGWDQTAFVTFTSTSVTLPSVKPAEFGSGHETVMLDPPHQLALIDHQQTNLFDDDYVGVGNHGLKFSPDLNFDAKMKPLLDAADQLMPLKDFEVPGSTAEIGTFISNAPAALKEFAAEHRNDNNVSVVQEPTIEGTFVKGQAVAEAPNLKDHLRSKSETGGNVPEPVHHVQGQGDVGIEASVSLETGGNTLMNIVTIHSAWLTGSVTAVLGAYVEVNAITQINVHSDHDSIGSSLNDWKLDTDHVSEAFNVASFQRIDLSDDGHEAAASPGEFPTGWAVTEIKGDMIFLNWVQQYNFVTDNDVVVISSTGVKTMVTTGENLVFNDLSFKDFGFHYDLIIVCGNIYDGNFIQQMNVLFDDDMVGAVGNFSVSGHASISTGNNLLWNQAEIVNVGGSDRFEAMPVEYGKAAENFKGGKFELPDEVLKDSAFAGMQGLSVLYVGGSIFDLQLVKQFNVVGDADQVALAMDKLDAVMPEAEWQIVTGSNELINVAQIVDFDSTGKTYVGDHHYSDEILIQAELVSPDDSLGGQDPDVLVTEVVVFLDDSAPSDASDATDIAAHHDQVDAPQPDVMQHLLG